jgi:replicative DNA helicase
MFLGDEPVAEGIGRLKPEDFAWRQHRLVFEAIQRVFQRGAPVDPVSVLSQLRSAGHLEDAGGIEYFSDISSCAPTSHSIVHHCDLIREASSRRKLATTCEQVIRDLEEVGGRDLGEIVDSAEKSIFEISHNVAGGQAVRLTSLMDDAVSQMEERSKSGKRVHGLASGFRLLDNLTGGFEPGELIVIAARPSMGKTAFALNVLDYIATTLEEPAGLYSLEMSKAEIANRIISMRTGVSATKFRVGGLTSDDLISINRHKKLLEDAALFIDDQPGDRVLSLRAKARRDVLHFNYKIIAIDYLQLMSGPTRSDNRNEEIGYISRGLKALARELSVPVIALSQLSRAPEQRSDRRPLLSDLRDSGSIEQDADMVMFLYRPDYYYPNGIDPNTHENIQGKCELNVAKNRNGPTGTIHFQFRKETMDFYESHREG